MIIKLSAFAFVSIAVLCGIIPVSVAAGDSDVRSPQEELSMMRNNLQQAKQKIDELERQLAADNLETAKRRIGELILQIQTKENEISALRSSAHENAKKLREDLASQTEELNQAKRRTAEVEQQLAAGKGQDLIQAKRRATEAEQQTTRKEQELAQVKRRITEVEQQMAGKEAELSQAKRRIAEAEQQTTGKEQELAQAKRRMAEAEQQTARKEQELAQVKDDLKQVTQKLADLNPQLMARDAELARMKQLLENLERNPSKPSEAIYPPEESLSEKNPPPPQSVEENFSVTNLPPPVPGITDDAEVLLSSDLGKMSERLASLLQPELRKGNATLRQRGNKLTLAFSTGELFTSGDATVSLGGTSLLERVGTVLHGFRYQSVEVAGHTDNTPLRNDSRKGFRDNIELSRTRAEHTSQALVNGGLDADRVKAVGYADTKPLAANDTEKGRSKNRRMEIVITQWLETGSNVDDAKTQVGKKLRGFSTQAVTHH
jgi:flagellar motor protein MotB